MTCLDKELPPISFYTCIQHEYLTALFADYLSKSKVYTTEVKNTYSDTDLILDGAKDGFEDDDIIVAVNAAITIVPTPDPGRLAKLQRVLTDTVVLQNLYNKMVAPNGGLYDNGDIEESMEERLEEDICEISRSLSSGFGVSNDPCSGAPTPSPTILDTTSLFNWCSVELITGRTGTAASNVTIAFPNIKWLTGNLTSHLNTSMIVGGINAAITATACADNSFVCCRANITITALNPIISSISTAAAAAIPSAISGAADANAVVGVVENSLKNSGFPFNVNTTSCYSLINLVTVFAGATISLIKDYVFGSSNGLNLVTNSFTDPTALGYVLNNNLYIGNITAGIEQGVATSNCTDQANLCCEVGKIIKTIPSNLTAFANSILTGSSIKPAITDKSSVVTVFNQVNGTLSSEKLVDHSINVTDCYPVNASAFISGCAIDLFKWPISKNPEQALKLNTTYILRSLPYVKNSLSALSANEIKAAVDYAETSATTCSLPPKDCCTIGLVVNSTNSAALSTNLQSQFSSKCSSTADIWALVGCVKGIMWDYIPTNTTDFSPCYPPITSDEVKVFIANCTGDIIRSDTDTEVYATVTYPDVRAFQLKRALRSTNQSITEEGLLQAATNLQCPNSANEPECCLRMSVINVTRANPSGISSSLLDGGTFLNNSVFNIPNTTVEVVRFTKQFMSDHGFPNRNSSACQTACPIETPLKFGAGYFNTGLDPYICGSPGWHLDRCYSINGKIYTVGGNQVKNFEQIYKDVFKADATEVLKLVRVVDRGSQAPCTGDSDCSGEEKCGLSKNINDYLPYKFVCGFQIAWRSPNQICSNGACPRGESNECKTDWRPIESKRLSCSQYSSSDYGYAGYGGGDLYGCKAANPDTCFHSGAPQRCCGCATWDVPNCDHRDSTTNWGVRCGLKVLPSMVANDICVNYNPDWMRAMLPFALVSKIASPAAYSYQFDDKSSTYQCHTTPTDTGYLTVNNMAYYLVACPDATLSTLKKIKAETPPTKVVQIYNNCPYPIWPAAAPNTAKIDASSDSSGACTLDNSWQETGSTRCSENTRCIASDVDIKAGTPKTAFCHWMVDHPYRLSGDTWSRVSPNDYILNPGEYMKFILPGVSSRLNDKLAWAGTFTFRLGCNVSDVYKPCLVSDCRKVKDDIYQEHYKDGYKCIVGVEPPAFKAEIAFGHKDMDYLDIEFIDATPENGGFAFIPGDQRFAPPGLTYVD